MLAIVRAHFNRNAISSPSIKSSVLGVGSFHGAPKRVTPLLKKLLLEGKQATTK